MNFEDQLHEAVEAGVQSYSGQKAWTISNALLFSFSIASSAGTYIAFINNPMIYQSTRSAAQVAIAIS